MNYNKMLERLLENGLSPRSESVIDGLMKYFKDAYYDFVNGDEENISIVRDLGSSLVELLESENYSIITASALLLRKYINSIYEIPPNCIENVIEALDSSVPTAARQAAFTLGCIACTKPSRGLQPPGFRPIDDRDAVLCLHCSGGFDRVENAEQVVPALIRNLHRPDYRDKSGKIKWASAIAIGEIGYTNPESVRNALDSLRICLKDERCCDAAVFALGCIGYKRPDFIEDIIPSLEECEASARGYLSSACRYALKKIGMETGQIIEYAFGGRRSLQDSMQLFFERMKEYEGGLVEESINAIKKLAKIHSKEIINILNDKLINIHIRSEGSGHLTQNISLALETLTEEHFAEMKDTVPILLEHFNKESRESYRTLDDSAMALKNIFKMCPEFIPKNIIKTLDDFLRDEWRGSVISNTKVLLEEVQKQVK